jgi:hypothetical protein
MLSVGLFAVFVDGEYVSTVRSDSCPHLGARRLADTTVDDRRTGPLGVATATIGI